MNPRASLLALALCGAAAAPVQAQSLTFTNPSGATTTFYGQVNLTYQGVDDGQQNYDNFVDNSNSVSRVGLWIDLPGGATEFRFNFEASLGLINTGDTNQIDNPPWIDWQRTDIRKLEGILSGGYGTLSFGQGNMATDRVAEVDFSGTTVVGYSNLPDTAGAFQFVGDGALSGITIGDVFKNFDGPRRFRLRYDTPDLSGVVFSAAYGQDVLAEDDDADYYDAALRYILADEIIEFEAAVGYAWKTDDGTTTRQAMASGSLTHNPTGLTVTVATGESIDGGGQYGYGKIGWIGDWMSAGSTALSVDYYGGSDFETDGSTSSSWGVQAVQNFDELNLEAYVGYRSFSYSDDTGTTYDDLSALLIGARWRF
jgi:hypothetical protein